MFNCAQYCRAFSVDQLLKVPPSLAVTDPLLSSYGHCAFFEPKRQLPTLQKTENYYDECYEILTTDFSMSLLLPRPYQHKNVQDRKPSVLRSQIILLFYYFLWDFFFILYSALLHLPSLRFHCADGCWDQTQDRCN
jgi:hypothetical protein